MKDANRKASRYPCPCCGYLTYDAPPGSYEICPICYWEDDISQLKDPRYAGGANIESLVEAQRNFAANGWCEARVAEHVRPPGKADRRDPSWRPIDPNTDDVVPVTGNLWQGKRIDLERAYYWRRRAA